MTTPTLVLASTSVYRRELLSRLGWPFDVCPPQVDETPQPGETPQALACRLAQAKALAVATERPGAVVIGSDQVADLAGQALGKPGHLDAARRQLAAMSGQTVRFHTAVCVARPNEVPSTAIDRGKPAGSAVAHRTECITVTVQFRHLTAADIEAYLQREQPFDCAGSAKCEALGIALLDAIHSDDPTALIGLPLIRTAAMLREAGLDPLHAPLHPEAR